MPTQVSTQQGDLYVTGNLSAKTMDIPTGAVRDENVDPNADIAATKMRHQQHHRYSQPNAAAFTATVVLHAAIGDGDLVQFRAGSIVKAAGAATVTVDLRKNGVSVLSAPITLDSTNANYVPEAETFSDSTFLADDVFDIVIVATAGGGTLPTGLYAELTAREKPQ